MLFRFSLKSTFLINGAFVLLDLHKHRKTLIFIHQNKQLKDHFFFCNSFTKLMYGKKAKIYIPGVFVIRVIRRFVIIQIFLFHSLQLMLKITDYHFWISTTWRNLLEIPLNGNNWRAKIQTTVN